MLRRGRQAGRRAGPGRRRLARGGSAGEVRRRSLAVVSGLSAVALAATTIVGIGPQPLVLLTTGSFVTVYALGCP
ncbi:hypothetical protein AB5J72_46850 [Streptomyces sp. CG1]|uniref:hypothetical protein n=1 Tax=Streptomyces sp. CG1 TaxID=1287523 RepID=UPI0034E1A37D